MGTGWRTSQDELDQIQQTLRGMLDAPGNGSEVGLQTPSNKAARQATQAHAKRLCSSSTLSALSLPPLAHTARQLTARVKTHRARGGWGALAGWNAGGEGGGAADRHG